MIKDKYHDIVRRALEKDGWTITDDPLRIKAGFRTISIDLGAERLIGAEKNGEKIAVEIKTFEGPSELQDFYEALGKINFYALALEEKEPERILFLAIPNLAFETFFQETLTQVAIRRYGVKLVVYQIQEEKIITWIK